MIVIGVILVCLLFGLAWSLKGNDLLPMGIHRGNVSDEGSEE